MGWRGTNRDWTVPAGGETPLYSTDGYYWSNCPTIIIERDEHCTTFSLICKSTKLISLIK